MPLLENLLSQGTVERLGWMLVHCLWQATAVALLLAGVLRLLRKSGANLRYVVSCLALTLMVVLPMLTIQFVSGAGSVAEPDPVLIIQPPPAPSPLLTAQAVAEMSPFAEPLTGLEPAAPPALSWREGIVSMLKPALPYAVFGWLLGVFGLSAWHLGGWAQLQRIKRRMVQQVGPALQNKAEDLGARLGVRRSVALLESALVEVPTVVGWIRPAILLPASALTGLSPDQLEAILAHELAHIRRYDYLVNVLQTVVEILGFYHPAVWWVSRRIRVERENCCDDLAVRVCGDSLQYARALTCMEEIRHRRTEWAVAATGGSLFARIARVLGRPAVDDQRFAWLPGLLTLVLITALLIPTAFVLGAAGPQQTNDSSDGMVVEDVNTASDLPEAQPGDRVKVRVQTDANDADAASAAEKAAVLLEFTIAEVQNDAALDRETTLQVLSILGETAQATAPDATQSPTAQEVLKKYVVGRQLPPETVQTLLDLLRARGYLQIETNPQVMTRDGAKASIRVGTEVPIPVPAQNGDTSQTTMENVECGTAIRVTPHVDRPDVVTLEMAVELTSVLPIPPGEETPRVRRRALESTLTLQTDRYFSLLMEPQPDKADETPAEAPVLVMVKPSIPEPQAAHVTEEGATPKHSANVRRRQVLLDARVVALERADLLNLGVEWGQPKLHAGFHYDSTGNGNIDSNQVPGIRMGYTSSEEFTASLLAALDLLHENGKADILANPRVLAEDGRQAQLKVVSEEYFMMTPPTPGGSSPAVRQLQKIETGTVLMVTPHVGDHNDMTLEMAIEVSDSIPSARGSGLPLVTRRIARNAVTIKDGGTVVLAGSERHRRSKDGNMPDLSKLPLVGPLFKNQNRDQPPREIAIFVTAHLVDAREVDTPPVPTLAETTVRVPPSTEVTRQTPGSSVPSGLAPSADSEKQMGLAIEVAMRVMTPGERFLKDLRGGARIKGVTSSRDTQALHEIGRTMSEGKPLVLDEERVSLLVKAMQTYPDCRALVAPKFLVPEGEPGRMVTGENVRYIVGNGGAGARQPSRRALNPSFDFQIVARRASPDAVALDASLRITTLLGFEDKKYGGRYPYQVPKTEEITLPLEHLTVPRGQTVVILGPKARLKPSDKPEAVLLLVKASLIPPPTAEVEQGKEGPKSPGISTKGDLIDILVTLMQRTGARIAVDATVKSLPITVDFDLASVPVPEALRRILHGTKYEFQVSADGTYVVYKPLTMRFEGESLREALADLSTSTGVPIITDPNVTGQVYADIREQPLEKALEILLVGTPYVVQITPEYYRVVERTPNYYLAMERTPIPTGFRHPEAPRTVCLMHITGDRAKSLLPAEHAAYVTVEPVDPNNRPQVLTVRAPPALASQIVAELQKMDTRPRQVLLDVRVVVMRHLDLPDLGIQFGTATLADVPSDLEGIRIGCARDEASTASLLTGLNRLVENSRAEVVAAPQLAAQENQPRRVPVITVTESPMTKKSQAERLTKRTELEKIDEGISLFITPYVNDHNNITLDMTLQDTESEPNMKGAMPIVTRHVLKNATTVEAGGTVVWAGLGGTGIEPKKRPAPLPPDSPLLGPLFRKNAKDRTWREVVVFVTAHPVDCSLTDSLPASQPAGTTIRIPPLPARETQGKREPRSMATATTGNLIEILTSLSQRTGAKITTDATVKPTPVALDFDPIDMPVAKALQRILQDTDYRFRIVGDNAYVVYRPITRLYAGRDLGEALLDLGDAAGVPIIPDANVTGRVYADIREQPVEKALEILLAGTPYVVKKTPDYYLVTDRRVVSLSPVDRETRDIHLTHITPERAQRLVPTDMAPHVTVEPVDPNNRRHILITAPPSLVDRIVADIQREDTRPRLLLLDARVIAIAHRDLLNLGIDWFAPTRQADTLADSAPGRDKKTQNGTIGGILVGYAQDRASTESLHAGLNQLLEDAQAEPIGSPQILAQDGRRCQLKLASEAWRFVPDSLKSRYLIQRAELQKIDANTALSITPCVSDHNGITLEMALEVRDRTPQDQSSDLPAVMRRVAENVVTIADGGTVVWAGLGESRLGQKKPTPPPGDLPLLGALFRKHGKDEPPREVVAFVTVHLVRDVPAANAADGARETRRIVASLEPRTE